MGRVKIFKSGDQRTEIKLARLAKREHNSDNKAMSKIEAYKNNIDPNAAWSNATSSMVNSIGGAAAAAFGKGGASYNGSSSVTDNGTGGDSLFGNNTKGGNVKVGASPLLYVALAIAAVFIFKK